MGWERTLLKSTDLKWQHKIKNTADGKMDFDLRLPLTDLFKAQAKQSYAQGLMDAINFIIKHEGDNFTKEDLFKLFNEAGLSDLNEALKKMIGE